MAGTIQGYMDTLDRILRILDADPNVDAMAMELSAMFAARQWKGKPETLDKTIEEIADAQGAFEEAVPGRSSTRRTKPSTSRASQPKFHAAGIPLYQSFERAAAAFARVLAFEGR